MVLLQLAAVVSDLAVKRVALFRMIHLVVQGIIIHSSCKRSPMLRSDLLKQSRDKMSSILLNHMFNCQDINSLRKHSKAQ
jgi:hypothetical protein